MKLGVANRLSARSRDGFMNAIIGALAVAALSQSVMRILRYRPARVPESYSPIQRAFAAYGPPRWPACGKRPYSRFGPMAEYRCTKGALHKGPHSAPAL